MSGDDAATVTVTGATGFIALHCIQQLLDAGYHVRGTARSVSRGEAVADILRPHLADPSSLDRLSVVAADLTSDAGWDDAVADTRYVLHVASPFPSSPPENDDDLIVPARDGALRVLRAAKAAGVERVVMTSSLAAVLGGVDRSSKIFDEGDWSNLDDPRIGAYEKSKTIAEQAAWDYARSTHLDLAVINPGAVLGPSLGPAVSTSAELVARLMNRDYPACPDVHFAMVDVRDVAAAHVAAMTEAAASGERFLCAIGDHSMREIAAVLDRHYGPKGWKVPTRNMPRFAVRVIALFDKGARLALGYLGSPQSIDNTKIREVLHWEPRGLEEMTVAMADSLIAHGVVKRR
jgi:dihydroflavonol-4-reductase